MPPLFESTKIDENKKRLVYIVIVLAVLALLLGVFAPNVFGQSDLDSQLPIKSALDQCAYQLVKTQGLVNETRYQCNISESKLQSMMDGLKFYTLSTCITLFFANAIVTFTMFKMLEGSKK